MYIHNTQTDSFLAYYIHITVFLIAVTPYTKLNYGCRSYKCIVNIGAVSVSILTLSIAT